jgi:hypothetical protein
MCDSAQAIAEAALDELATATQTRSKWYRETARQALAEIFQARELNGTPCYTGFAGPFDKGGNGPHSNNGYSVCLDDAGFPACRGHRYKGEKHNA